MKDTGRKAVERSREIQEGSIPSVVVIELCIVYTVLLLPPKHMYDALVFNIHLNTLLYSSSVTVIIFSMELKVITIIHLTAISEGLLCARSVTVVNKTEPVLSLSLNVSKGHRQ